MSHTPETVRDPELRARLTEVQQRIEQKLPTVDPHQRLSGKPVSYGVISGQTFEIVFKEVPSIDEAEVMAVKRLIGGECFCSVAPHTAETLLVRFVVPLKRGRSQT